MRLLTLTTTIFYWIFFINLTYAQTVEVDWGRSVDSNDKSSVRYIRTDTSGNVLTVGTFQNTIDFDPGPNVLDLTGAAGRVNVFIQKLDKLGNLIWAKKMFDLGPDSTLAGGPFMRIDPNNDIYVAGNFKGVVDFDPGPNVFSLTARTQGKGDVFVAKFDPMGDFIWAKRTGGGQSVSSLALNLDGLGNVYCSGNFVGAVDFDPSSSVFSDPNLPELGRFVQKLDSAGNLLWAKGFAGANAVISFDDGSSVDVDINGNVYVTGGFGGSRDFDPGPDTFILNSGNQGDVYVMRLDWDGDFRWAKQISLPASTWPSHLVLDPSGEGVYIMSSFAGTIDLDPGIDTFHVTSAGDGQWTDLFVLKLTTSGQFTWAKNIGVTGSPTSNFPFINSNLIETDLAGNVYIACAFLDDIDADPGPGYYKVPAINNNIGNFLLKLTPGGDFDWAALLETTAIMGVTALEIGNDNNIYAAGYLRGTMDFEFGPGNYYLSPSSSSFANYVVKWNPNSCDGLVSGIDYKADFSCAGPGNAAGLVLGGATPYQYSWNTTPISSGLSAVFADTGLYDFVVIDSEGCTDTSRVLISGLVLDASEYIDTSLSLNGFTLTANAVDTQGVSITYQWVDCDHGNTPVSGATGRSFSPPSNGNYAVIINRGDCSVMSACIAVNTVGIDPGFQAALNVYPNPSTGKVQVELGSYFQATDIEIVNSRGQKLARRSFGAGDKISLQLPNLDGLYFIKVHADGKRAVLKVIRR